MNRAAAGVPLQAKPLAQKVVVWAAAASIVKVPVKAAVEGVTMVPKSTVPPPVICNGFKTLARAVALAEAALAPAGTNAAAAQAIRT